MDNKDGQKGWNGTEGMELILNGQIGSMEWKWTV